MKRTLAVAALLVLLGTSACSGFASEAEMVEVQIRHSRFDPDHYEFRAGTTVEFVVTNTDPIDHEFIIGDEGVQRAHEEGTEAHHGAKPGEISIPAGETRSTTYTFDEPGTLIFGCHLPSHYNFGMRGEITITS